MTTDKKNTKVKDVDSIESLSPIKLLKPKFENAKSIIKAFQQRKTIREISDKKLSLQMLSDLLWAAGGVNRKQGPFGMPGITSATASDSQEIDIYVALKEGIYLYNAIDNKLIPVVAGDFRKLAIGKGQASFGDNAPVRLIYIADIEKLYNTQGFMEPGLRDAEIQRSYYFIDTGIIAGNVYLFAASQGLASWFHNCNKQELSAKLKLRNDQRILFGHTIGYPAKK